MTFPVYKIQTYTGAVLDHTIENEAINIYTKDILTSGIGHFTFSVPTKKNGGYYYDDIALHDKVKIYFGYDSVGANPDFIGRVCKISGSLSCATGATRVISGLSQGEILLRRQKTNKRWNTGASTIATAIATDLSLGAGSIEADATTEEIKLEDKPYFDILREVSDYWSNAGSQVKKDYWVNPSNSLVWASRDGTAPFRSGASVETFTVGDNIIDYAVDRIVDSVKNNITVYGALEKYTPSADEWCEALTDWTAIQGTLALNGAGQIGADAVKCTCPGGGDHVNFYHTNSSLRIYDGCVLTVWLSCNQDPTDEKTMRLWAPDSTNYYETNNLTLGLLGWTENNFTLGTQGIYDADRNPNGDFTETGTPYWKDIQAIQFEFDWPSNDKYCIVDGVFYYPTHFKDSASDGTSQTSYGQRDLVKKDIRLTSDSDCQKRAETLLYQLKDPPVQITLTTPGNTNVLLGDRLSMTIPAENISAANYDVISVEHSVSNQGFRTRATMIDSASVRYPPAKTAVQLLGDLRQALSEISRDELLIR